MLSCVDAFGFVCYSAVRGVMLCCVAVLHIVLCC